MKRIAACVLLFGSLRGGLLFAQMARVVQSDGDVATLHTLVDEVLADPKNEKPRRLLEHLVKQRLVAQIQDTERRRADALVQGLQVSARLHADSDTNLQLMQALQAIDPGALAAQASRPPRLPSVDAGPGDDLFTSLLREALRYYEQGQRERGFVALVTALAVHPRLPRMMPRLEKAPGLVAAEKARVVSTSTSPAAGTPPAAPASPEMAFQAQRQFRTGLREYSAGRLEEAARLFREGLAYDPGNEWIKRSLERTLVEIQETRPGAAQAAAAPSTVPPAVSSAPVSGVGRYVPQDGETLWKVAKKVYGDPYQWRLILDANPGLQGAARLRAGVPIVIPPGKALRHKARKGDSLWILARRYYGNPHEWRRILDANPRLKEGWELKEGTVLLIPPPAAAQSLGEAR